MESCSVGLFLKEECHLLTYCRTSGLCKVDDLSEEEIQLLQRRSTVPEVSNVCFHHKKVFLNKYAHVFGRSCCDPDKVHKRPVKFKNLHVISLEEADRNVSKCLIPGKALCNKCVERLKEKTFPCRFASFQTNQTNESDGYFPESPTKRNLMKINEVCAALAVSPIKCGNNLLSENKMLRKYEEIIESVKNNLGSICKRPISLSLESKIESDYKCLIEDVKKKLATDINFDQKMQLITLLPKSWSIERTLEELDGLKVSKYAIEKARSFVQKEGILAKKEEHRGRKRDSDVDEIVTNFYLRQDISRECPGMKDVKSIKLDDGKRTHKQKRLLLDDLKDIFNLFKLEYPEVKIGFSKFAALRPQWCILAGDQGTHTVCVCTSHQNLKLMTTAINCTTTTNDVLELVVCDIQNEACMSTNTCQFCPKTDSLDELIEKHCETVTGSVTYKQWIKQINSYKLLSCSCPVDDFKAKLKDAVLLIKNHQFVAKAQAKYLNYLRENIDDTQCIILCDFAENYKFVVQDAIQSFHWDNTQATLHPFAVYYKNESGTTAVENFCIISDTSEHNSIVFYAFQREIINCLRIRHPKVKKNIYFSDGAASQYKNKNNFSNLMYHQQDYQMDAEWHFFATSHGKSPCDGIGGTVKRLARRASLQSPVNGQILTPQDLYEFASKNIQGITTIFVSKEKISTFNQTLNNRYRLAKTIPDTRKFHCFIPLSPTQMQVRVTSTSHSFKNVLIFKDNKQ